MFLIAVTACCATAVWAAIAFSRGSIFLSMALFMVGTIVFPAEFASVQLAGLTWTFDRLCFVLLLTQGVLAWKNKSYHFLSFESSDLALGLFTLWLFARTITQPLGSVLPEQPPTLMHLINGYLIPFGLYATLRLTPIDFRKLKPALLVLLALLCYLSLTAFLEKAQLWSLVWPKFISDPTLGIHFGRARGPMLQSVRLGMCLIVGWTAITIYTIWLRPHDRLRWAIFLVATALVWPAIFFTSTRSIWMGLIFTVGIFVLMALKGMLQRAFIFAGAAGAFVVLLMGPNVLAFKRELGAEETKESAYMRVAFAYVSVQMFKDKPLAGHGFNQFQVYNLPYLADRSTSIRIESIRGYVHHNGFLSLLVDLGLVGFTLYIHLMLTLIFQAIALWRVKGAPKWVRGLSILSLSFIGTHAIQMAFHELSFSTIENSLLFMVCGFTVAASQQYCVRPQNSRRRPNDREATGPDLQPS